MSGRYGLVDADGLVVNVVEWDGEAAWTAPEGLNAVEVDEAVSIGWRQVVGGWIGPAEGE